MQSGKKEVVLRYKKTATVHSITWRRDVVAIGSAQSM
jgi:hypothetical protein